MNQHIPDREPERRLPGPWTEADVQDELAFYGEMDAYDRARLEAEQRRGAELERWAIDDDDGEHGASETIQRWENERWTLPLRRSARALYAGYG